MCVNLDSEQSPDVFMIGILEMAPPSWFISTADMDSAGFAVPDVLFT